MRPRQEPEEPPRLGALLASRGGHRDLGGLRRRVAEQAKQHRRAGGLVAGLERWIDPERGEDASERAGQAAGILAHVEPHRMETEGRELCAQRSQAVVRQHRREGLGDQVQHVRDLVDGHVRLMRRLVEQPRRHVVLGGGFEVRGEQREREAIGLAGVPLLEHGDVHREGAPRVQPRGERGRCRAAPLAHAEPGEREQSAAMALDGQPAMKPERLRRQRRHHERIAVAIAAIHDASVSHAGGGADRIVRRSAASSSAAMRGSAVPQHGIDEVETVRTSSVTAGRAVRARRA